MILGNSDGVAGEHGPTLDELFRRAGARHPQAIALMDPPNRESFADGAPRVLSYAEADWLISAFAARLCDLGLHTDAVVAIQA
jgi:non-ribosomal peptide synthetase component E (peptide arylation enzyme)